MNPKQPGDSGVCCYCRFISLLPPPQEVEYNLNTEMLFWKVRHNMTCRNYSAVRVVLLASGSTTN